jgi:hypothetical protein
MLAVTGRVKFVNMCCGHVKHAFDKWCGNISDCAVIVPVHSDLMPMSRMEW